MKDLFHLKLHRYLKNLNPNVLIHDAMTDFSKIDKNY